MTIYANDSEMNIKNTGHHGTLWTKYYQKGCKFVFIFMCEGAVKASCRPKTTKQLLWTFHSQFFIIFCRAKSQLQLNFMYICIYFCRY